jgi:DNA (cytosine-5)-methyltransferase 1
MYDLFCKAGGTTRGYQQAGFRVIGVDIEAQPHYCGDGFVQMNALEFLDRYTAGEFERAQAFHASPPCQAFTSLKAMWNAREHPDLVGVTRDKLRDTDRPWVLENVPGAPIESGIILCGTMFRLGCEGAELRRHRLFETPFPLLSPFSCQHGWSGRDATTVGVYGHAGGYSQRQKYCVIGVYGGHGRDKRRRKNGQHFPTSARAEAMGIDWMTGTELSQAIPPAYTHFIGAQLRRVLEAA